MFRVRGDNFVPDGPTRSDLKCVEKSQSGGRELESTIAEAKMEQKEEILSSERLNCGNLDEKDRVLRESLGGEEEQKAEDLGVEEEWEQRRRQPEKAEIVMSSDPQARTIVEGFRIDCMNMRDAASGCVLWEEDGWGDDMFYEELEAHLPANILELEAVSREIVFTSRSEIQALRLSQKLILNGVAIEEWQFYFGFVMPGSTNSWQQTIAGADERIDASVLSGNLLIETSFYDGVLFLCKSAVRVFYDM